MVDAGTLAILLYFSRPRLYTCADFAVLYYPEISCKSLPTSTTNNIRKERKKKEESKSFVVVDDGVLIFLETDYVSFQKMSSSSATMSTGVSSKPVIYQENYDYLCSEWSTIPFAYTNSS